MPTSLVGIQRVWILQKTMETFHTSSARRRTRVDCLRKRGNFTPNVGQSNTRGCYQHLAIYATRGRCHHVAIGSYYRLYGPSPSTKLSKLSFLKHCIYKMRVRENLNKESITFCCAICKISFSTTVYLR